MQLAGADKYHPDKLPELEKFVQDSANSDAYSLDAILALLRHYQFSPSSIKIPILAKALLKALSQLPRNDFHTCIMLVPERLLSDETVQTLVALATALETTRFSDFWTLAAAHKDLVAQVPGFQAAVRKYTLHILGTTYQRVNRRVLGSAVNLEGQALEALIADQVKTGGWQVQGEVIALPRNELNTPVVVKRTEMIRFEQIASVLRCVTSNV